MISISMQQKCIAKINEVLLTQQKEYPESRNTVDGNQKSGLCISWGDR